MNPHTGEIIELAPGQLPPPEFPVFLQGPRQDIERISTAVKLHGTDAARRDANRRRNKAARAARRKGRR